MMLRLLISFVFVVGLAYAEPAADTNSTEENNTKAEQQSKQQHILSRLQQLQSEADTIDNINFDFTRKTCQATLATLLGLN